MENIDNVLQEIKTQAVGGGANFLDAICQSYDKVVLELARENAELKNEIISLKGTPKPKKKQSAKKTRQKTTKTK